MSKHHCWLLDYDQLIIKILHIVWKKYRRQVSNNKNLYAFDINNPILQNIQIQSHISLLLFGYHFSDLILNIVWVTGRESHPQKHLTLAICNFGRPGLTCSDHRKNSLFKQERKVLLVVNKHSSMVVMKLTSTMQMTWGTKSRRLVKTGFGFFWFQSKKYKAFRLISIRICTHSDSTFYSL